MLNELPVLESTNQDPSSEQKIEIESRRPTVAFVTLGCKINQYETEAVREEILDLGYQEVPSRIPADVYVVNTCSVTRRSGVKSRKYIQRVARLNPQAKILVMGCSTPSEKDSFRQVPQVAVLAGNEEKGMIASFLASGVRPGELVPDGPLPQLKVPKKGAPLPEGVTRDMMDLQIHRFEGRTRGYIKIQDGCNSFCSFCIIPFLRGLSRSRSPESVLDETRRLAQNGFREVVLAGIHLQDYGDDFEGDWSLTRLMHQLRDIAYEEGIWRIRLSSIGVQSFTDEMVELIRDPLFCPHWHIPLQSGSDRVLEEMRRDYTRQEFLDSCSRLEDLFDRPSITTDIIVGHPGEDEEAYQETVETCLKVGFSKIHLFPYSQREGTRAATLPNQVDPATIQRRMKELGVLEKELARRYKEKFLGEQLEILVEGPVSKKEDPEGLYLEGFTERYIKARFHLPEGNDSSRAKSLLNTLQTLKIKELQPEYVVASLDD